MEEIKNWQEEKRSAYIYRALATLESNPVHKKLFLDLATMADKQASIWLTKLSPKEAQTVTPYCPDWRAKIIIKLVRYFGARALRIALTALKIRGMSIYLGAQLDDTIHPTAEGVESKHHSFANGNNLRAAVFGMNDGLISNMSLILGIAGAHAGHALIVLSGITGLLAGAFSMGTGEYVSVRSQREMLEYQLALEKSELLLYPEEEAEELALIYEARGLPKEEAIRVANLLIKNPDKALDTLAREELGINPKELVSPYGAAFASFISFALGAFVPLIPFIFINSEKSLIASIGLTGLTLFTVGALLSIFTQRNVWYSGFRMLLIGSAAGIITYYIGGFIKWFNIS